MDTEERKHLTRLRCAQVRRMRVLELQQAKLGLHAPEHIFIEIDELSEKITAIDVQLNGASKAHAPSPISISSLQTAQIEIVFKGDFSTLTPELQRAIIPGHCGTSRNTTRTSTSSKSYERKYYFSRRITQRCSRSVAEDI